MTRYVLVFQMEIKARLRPKTCLEDILKSTHFETTNSNSVGIANVTYL